MEDPPLIAATAAGDTDLISSLPDVIIHHILYLLDAPKQAARIGSLSRRWLHLWRSYPVLEFRREEFGESAAGDRKSAEFAAASARRISLYYENFRTPLDSFRLSMLNPQSYPESDKFLSLASISDYGSPLEVVIRTGSDFIFQEGSFSHCSRTKVLNLDGCSLNRLGTISLQSLQVLHLDNVKLTEQSLYDFVANAPNLESLSLRGPFEIERMEITVSNFPKLKTLIIHTQPQSKLRELQLTAAPCLERFVLIESSQPCEVRAASLSSAPNLKFVRMERFYRQISRLDLDDFIIKLPALQVLYMARVYLGNQFLCTLMANTPNLRSLRFCSFFHGIDRIEISHRNLSNLEIIPNGTKFYNQLKFQLTSTPCLKILKIADSVGVYQLDIESLSAAPNLKVLEFSVPKGFTQSHLDYLMSKLPYLESLYLLLMNGRNSEMRKLRVSSHRLRVFGLRDMNPVRFEPLEELEIDAPNLVSAQCGGSGFRLPGKINVVNAPSDCRFLVSGFSCGYAMYLTHEWFLRLRQSLSGLSQFPLVLQWHGLVLQSYQVSFDLSRVECTSPPLIIIQRLKLDASFWDPHHVQNGDIFLDGLFWAFRPKSICIPQKYDGHCKFAKFIYEQFKNKDGGNCCVGAKCWRHELRDVKVGNAIYDDNSIMTIDISGNEDPPLAKLAEVLFTLTWR